MRSDHFNKAFEETGLIKNFKVLCYGSQKLSFRRLTKK